LKITFLGATGTVTGSKYLVETEKVRVLVDCGLYQGVKQLRLRNWQRAISPKDVDAVVLSHAHIDHSGYLPALVRDGYTGPVYCTPPTQALCRIVLPDSGRIHEEDAAYANRKGFTRHRPARALYTEQEAAHSLERLAPLEFGDACELEDLQLTLRPAGHILGAASVELRGGNGTLLLSGDLGRSDDLLMGPPQAPGSPDWVVIESTYGDRCHARIDPVAELAGIVNRTLDRGGTLLIPAFAVARAQSLLHCLQEIFRRGLAPEVPIYLNSPMATSVTEIYERFPAYHRLSPEGISGLCANTHFVRTVEESQHLTQQGRIPAVILSASGMATAGRVLHHLRGLAPDRRNTILLPGFQAPGTRGEAIARGVGSVKIHGSQVPIEAEVVHLDIFSAHADQSDLLRWLGESEPLPRKVFVTHGEPVSSDVLRREINNTYGVDTRVPEFRDEVELYRRR
jgi:metallo-beta-lactamase family protein